MKALLIAATSLVALFSAISAPSQATAKELSLSTFKLDETQGLFKLCSVDPESAFAEQALSFCYGYVDGAYSVHEAITANGERARLVCPPDKVTRDDAVWIFLEWAGANQDKWTNVPVEDVFQAWIAKYPCPEQ